MVSHLTLVQMYLTASTFTAAALCVRLAFNRHIPQAVLHWLWNLAGLLFVLPVRIPALFRIDFLSSRLHGENPVGLPLTAYKSVVRIARLSASDAARLAPYEGYLIVLSLLGGLLGVILILVCKKVENSRLNPWTTVQDKLSDVSGHNIALRATPYIQTPCAVGIIRPKIYFPQTWDFEDREATRMALYHELAHIKHSDNLRKLFFCMLLCLQWYNPMVWLLYMAANRDMERYSDEYVLGRIAAERRSDYARLLLSGDGGKQGMGISACFAKHALKKRIIFIMKYAQRSRKLSFCSGLIALALALLFVTGLDWVRPQSTGVASFERLHSDLTPSIYDTLPLALKNGDIFVFEAAYGGDGRNVPVQFSLDPVQGYYFGQTVEYGYVKDGAYVAEGVANLLLRTVIRFSVAEPDVRQFYIRNSCPDTIYLNAFKVKD